MDVSGPTSTAVQIKRWSPTDPAVDAAGLPTARDVASRLIDNMLMAKHSADNLRAMIKDGVEHTRGMATLVAGMIENLPADTSEEEWAAWQREAAGHKSQLRYLEEEKETLAWRDQNYEKLLTSVMSRVGSLLSPEDGAALLAERQAAFERRFPEREAVMQRAVNPESETATETSAQSTAGTWSANAGQPSEAVERYRATWLAMLSQSLGSGADGPPLDAKGGADRQG
jgi:hypothetical protein